MRKYLFIICLQAFAGCTKSQTSPYIEFISTFDEIPQGDAINFSSRVNEGQRMTQREAIQFIFDGDSTRIYCSEYKVDLENERKSRIIKKLKMPEKNFIVRYDSFVIVCYSYFNCVDQNQPSQREMKLSLIDSKGQFRDSIRVFVEDEFEILMSGTFNTKSMKIFITGKFEEKGLQAFLYKIDPDRMSFSIEKRLDSVGIILPDLDRGLESLGWKHLFYGQ